MVDSEGRTPLILACIHKAPEKTILALLETETKAAFIKDKTGRLPLHCAIQSWQYDHVIERIVKSNPNALKSKDDSGRTPIGLAVELARKDDVSNELAWHHAIMRHDWDGRTPLHWACIEHMPSKLLLRLLFVERNAASIKDKDGRYPLHLAALHDLHEPILDRLIRAYPKCL
ncbi:ankyrin, partial [Fragilariopsis cylindrus CCMP1102]